MAARDRRGGGNRHGCWETDVPLMVLRDGSPRWMDSERGSEPIASEGINQHLTGIPVCGTWLLLLLQYSVHMDMRHDGAACPACTFCK